MIIRKIRLFFSHFKALIRIKRSISPFFENGLYAIKNNALVRRIIFFRPFIVICSHTKKSRLAEGYVYIGPYSKKVTVVTKNITFGLYNNDSYSLSLMHNIAKYKDKLPYESSGVLAFEIKKRLIAYETIDGRKLMESDLNNGCIYILKTHVQILKTKILRNKILYYGSNRCLFYVQHGDLDFTNMLIDEHEHFVVFDYDHIDIYPALFDFFTFISYHRQLITNLINGEYDDLIREVFENTSESTVQVNSLVDKYLAKYLDVSKFQKNNYRQVITKKYPKSYKKLNIIL